MIIKKKITLKDFTEQINTSYGGVYSEEGLIELYNYLKYKSSKKNPIFFYNDGEDFHTLYLVNRYIEFDCLSSFSKKYKIYYKDYSRLKYEEYFCTLVGDAGFIIDIHKLCYEDNKLYELFYKKISDAMLLYNVSYSKEGMETLLKYLKNNTYIKDFLNDDLVHFNITNIYREFESFSEFSCNLIRNEKKLLSIITEDNIFNMDFFLFKTKYSGFIININKFHNFIRKIKDLPEEHKIYIDLPIQKDMLHKKIRQNRKRNIG